MRYSGPSLLDVTPDRLLLPTFARFAAYLRVLLCVNHLFVCVINIKFIQNHKNHSSDNLNAT
jgi:hypothetical protein